MAKYSKAHERDESSKMWRGFWHSTFGILLCWVPLLGLLLSISGFARQVVRMTEKHRARMVLLILYGLISLCISIGAILGGLYAYSRNPDVLTNAVTWGWKQLTGQATLPGQMPANDYTGNQNPGLGTFMDDNMLQDEGDMLTPEEQALAPEGDSMLTTDDLDADGQPTTGQIGPDDSETPDEEGRAIDLDHDAIDALGVDDDDLLLADSDLFFDDDYQELDFGYEVVDDSFVDEGELVRVDYKVIIDKYDPTDEDLTLMFDEIIYEDGFDLHSMSIYRDQSEANGEYTVARITEAKQDEEPTVERK